ncbi:MAG: DUF2510 domain-containing protein [Actinomycetota bacterium]|nr:DUF2510 domain-containing protein [Actinomycetota bacterium]MDA3034915.1 DUF2510 domain-containing protein [Actinomycetota bacterium]
MLEFTSVSVSSYEAATLSDALNAHAADGWSVVQIVPAGTVIVAYLSRPTTGASTAAATTTMTATAAVAATPAATASATPVVDAPAPAPAPAVEPMAAAAAPAPAPADAVPAGWYPDPSSRFELRYWDGTRWTEHVSRGGQQSTDPPVA